VRCGACGSFAQSPQLDRESLARWFDSAEYQGGPGVAGSAYADYAGDEAARTIEADTRLADIRPHLGAGARVFEIGCASGSLLAAIAKTGCRVAGCDLSPRFAELGRRAHGLEIAVADYLSLDPAPASVDAILIFGTLGNLQDLPAVLARVRRHLVPGGLVFANFPASDSLIARIYGARHWMFAPSISQFPTRAGVRKAFAAAGFAIESLRRDRQRPSFGKFAKHARWRFVSALLGKWGLSNRPIPVALPIPGVFMLRARADVAATIGVS